LIRPKTARRERLWMEAVDLHYISPGEIAQVTGLSVRRIQYGIKRARGMALDFATVWDIEWRMTPNAFNQVNQCEQHNWEDIPKGLAIGCMACLRSGLDHLIRAGRTPKPEKPTGPLEEPETRRQRRDQRKGFAT
jgi:hypothetical protein